MSGSFWCEYCGVYHHNDRHLRYWVRKLHTRKGRPVQRSVMVCLRAGKRLQREGELVVNNTRHYAENSTRV